MSNNNSWDMKLSGCMLIFMFESTKWRSVQFGHNELTNSRICVSCKR